MKTYMAKKEDAISRWILVDATDKILGRLSSRIATILMGKHRPTYTPHVDTGDFVVVINAKKIKLTGKKLEQMKYYRHSGYLGHLKETPVKALLEKRPEEVIRRAVRRMLPKTKLGHQMLSKLKIYAGGDHPHKAQAPEPIEL